MNARKPATPAPTRMTEIPKPVKSVHTEANDKKNSPERIGRVSCLHVSKSDAAHALRANSARRTASKFIAAAVAEAPAVGGTGGAACGTSRGAASATSGASAVGV